MGFLDRFIPRKRREERLSKEARGLEMEGDLGGAVERYLEAGLPNEAARVLLLRADAEREFDRRIAFCTAASTTATDDELRAMALLRKARLAFDVLRSRATAVPSELVAVARDLEAAGDPERAADAYALAGDVDGEVRALTAAGAIDRLEDRLRSAQTEARGRRELEATARRVTDLDKVAERREALALAEALLARTHDESIADAARRIRARLVREAIVAVELDGHPFRVAFGGEVTLGRGDATIVLASRSVSRRHVRVSRKGATGEIVLEDLETRNGTFVAGARIAAAMPIGGGLVVHLGGEIPVRLEPAMDVPGCEGGALAPVWVEVAGDRYLAPLGPLRACGWSIDRVAVGADHFLTVDAAEAKRRPFLGEYELAARIELCFGDEIADERRGPARLRVAPPAGLGSGSGRTPPPSGAGT